MKVIEAKTVRTTTVRRVEINREALILLFATAGIGSIPSSANIYIKVPGGGDWSNMQLDISSDTPVVVTWSEVVDNDL